MKIQLVGSFLAGVLCAALALPAATEGSQHDLALPEAPPRFKRIVICLDGTWGNPYATKAGAIDKPSNVAKIYRAIVPLTADGIHQVTYYDTGVGAMRTYPGFANRALKLADRTIGGAWGAGFEDRLDNAYRFLAANYSPGDQVYIFGFSRGAATARALSRFVSWLGALAPPTTGRVMKGAVLKKDSDYYTPLLLDVFISSEGATLPDQDRDRLLFRIGGAMARSRLATTPETGDNAPPPSPEDLVFTEVHIAFLGVWETVLSLGSRLRARRSSREFFLGETPATAVRVARQALAIDERRYDFTPWIWTDPGGADLEQRWFAGVHTNVGGGDVNDGLANYALAWMLHEAELQGLVFDWGFLRHYRGFPMDVIHKSRKWFYKVKEVATLKRKRGLRELMPGGPEAAQRAHLSLDCSVLHRVFASPLDYPSLHKDGYAARSKALREYVLRCGEDGDPWSPAVEGQVGGLRGEGQDGCLPVRPSYGVSRSGTKSLSRYCSDVLRGRLRDRG